MIGIAPSCRRVVPPRATARATALVLLLCALGRTGPAAGQSLPPDSLIEIVAYRVPQRFQVRGAAINDSGTVLYWSDSAAAVVAQNAMAIGIVCPRLPRRPIAAAFVSDSPAVEIVDAGSGAVLRRDGDCRQIFPLRAAGEFVWVWLFCDDAPKVVRIQPLVILADVEVPVLVEVS